MDGGRVSTKSRRNPGFLVRIILVYGKVYGHLLSVYKLATFASNLSFVTCLICELHRVMIDNKIRLARCWMSLVAMVAEFGAVSRPSLQATKDLAALLGLTHCQHKKKVCNHQQGAMYVEVVTKSDRPCVTQFTVKNCHLNVRHFCPPPNHCSFS